MTGITAQINSSLQAQSITFGTAPTPTYSPSGTFLVTATASPSNLPVTFSSLTPSICTTSSTSSPATVTMLFGGTCQIAANQAGDSTFSAAPQVTQSINIPGPVMPVSGPPAMPVPTVSEWVMILMVCLLSLLGVARMGGIV